MAKKINVSSYTGGEPKKSSSSGNPLMIKTASMNKNKSISNKRSEECREGMEMRVEGW